MMPTPLRNPMTGRGRKGARAAAVAAAGVAGLLVLAGCSAPGGTASTSTAVADTITAPVTAEQVKALGNVTLNVWADQGEQDLMKSIVPAYEKSFPNVTVKVQFKSFNDLTATVLNAMNSDSAPDVTQGNQGWATDGALVKAHLIRPLDDVAKAYGYLDAAGAAASQLKWSSDGKTFGSGSLYGMSPDNQMVGVFYNKKKLAKLNLSAPTTFSELTSDLAAAKAAGETPITLGNSDKGSAMQAFSVVQGAMAPAAGTVDWITGKSGSDFNSSENAKALDLWASWAKNGTISAGYDGTSPDDAAGSFAKGNGVFYFGGNWEASNIADGSTFGFIPAPSGAGNTAASNGSFGLPWHISTKSKSTLAAIAFVGLINAKDSGRFLAAVNRVPIQLSGVNVSDPMFTDLIAASKKQLANNGALYYYDWSTPTMFDLFTSDLQEVMAGKLSSADMLTAVQKNWKEFQSK